MVRVREHQGTLQGVATKVTNRADSQEIEVASVDAVGTRRRR